MGGSMGISKAVAAIEDPISGTLSVDKTTVNTGEDVRLTISGQDDNGVTRIAVYYGGEWHTQPCDGVSTVCTNTFIFSEHTAGNKYYTGYVYGNKLNGVEEGVYTIPYNLKVAVYQAPSIMPQCENWTCDESTQKIGALVWLHDTNIDGKIDINEALVAISRLGQGLNQEQVCGVVNVWQKNCTVNTCSDLSCSYVNDNYLSVLTTYDTNQNKKIDLNEILKAPVAYQNGSMSKPGLCALTNFWQKGCSYMVPDVVKPDLIVTDIRAVYYGYGDTKTVSFFVDIKNVGNKNIAQGTGIPYIAYFDGNRIICDRNYTGGLDIGETHSMSCSAGKVVGLGSGSHEVQARVDDSDEIDESNENNNLKTKNFFLVTDKKKSPCGNYGDANADGYVTEVDVTLCSKYILGNTSGSIVTLCDVDGNGSVNSLDITKIERYIAGLDSTFPVCDQQEDRVVGTLEVVDTTVSIGEEIVLHLTAQDDQGVDKILAYYNGKWNTQSCNGTTQCAKTFAFIETTPGTKTYHGYVNGKKLDNNIEGDYTSPRSVQVEVTEGTPVTSCTDSDGGVYPNTCGYCKDSRGVTVNDGCLRSDGSGPLPEGEYVSEAFCLTNEMREYCKKYNSESYCDNLANDCYAASLIPAENLAWSYFPRKTDYFCKYGCKDGACIKNTEKDITVISPNGGERWVMNKTYDITWDSSKIALNEGIKITFSTQGYAVGMITRTSNTGSYAWDIDKTQIGMGKTIPAGLYKIDICSDNGICDSSDKQFSIVSADTTNKPPVIDGLTGPTKLKVNERGAWKIKAHDPENGSLSYSIDWGDTKELTPKTLSQSTQATIQSAYFTHTYSQAGNYTVKIAVTDNNQQTAESAVSVNVGEVDGWKVYRNDEYKFKVYYPNNREYREIVSNQGYDSVRIMFSENPPQQVTPDTLVIYPNGDLENRYSAGKLAFTNEIPYHGEFEEITIVIGGISAKVLVRDHAIFASKIYFENNGNVFEFWCMDKSFYEKFISTFKFIETPQPVTPGTSTKCDFPDGTLIKLPGDYKVYVIRNCERVWVRTQEEFKQQGYKWEDVQETSAGTTVVQSKQLQSNARLLREIGGSMVYYITESGMRRHIPTAEVFNSYGNKWEDITEVDKATINSYGENVLIKVEGDEKVYELKNRIKRWIKTAEAFNRLKYDWKKIAPVNRIEMNTYQEGSRIE